MCLAQFATSYTVCYSIPQKANFDKDGCSQELSYQFIFHTDIKLPSHLNLQNNMGCMRLRRFPQVMRIHSSKRKEGHEEHYSELLLHCHWRDEVKEFCRWSAKDCVSVYEERKEELKQNKSKIFPGEEVLDVIDTEDISEMKPTHLYDTLASQNVQQNEDDLLEGCSDAPEFESIGYTGNLASESHGPSETSKFKVVKIPCSEELDMITRRLVSEQMDAFRMIVSTMKDVVRARENLSLPVKALRLIIHGGAGVGKSAFIRAASVHAEKILRMQGDDPSIPRVLICAPTGKAASLIGEWLYQFSCQLLISYLYS